MASLQSTARRLDRIVRALGPTSPAAADRSPWDWYADTCPCRTPPGECRAPPRAGASQRPPDGDWRTRLLLMGRGAGKTRSAAEWIRRRAAADPSARLALVGATAADV